MTFQGGFIFRWVNSALSRNRLGHAETMRHIEQGRARRIVPPGLGVLDRRGEPRMITRSLPIGS
jgi:hypothetical protein